MGLEVDYETRRKIDSERRRLMVLKTAGQCFGEKGYKKTTADEIARRSGVSKGLVFHFFGSKRQLFETVLEDSLNQWVTLSEYSASGLEGNSLEELRRLFMASFDFIAENPVLVLFARPDEGLLKTYRAKVTRHNLRWRARIQRTLKEGMRNSEIRKLDAQRVSVILHEVQAAFLSNALSGSSSRQYDRKTVDLTVDILLRGIRA
jgi:AcrR family transcriptional regulator